MPLVWRWIAVLFAFSGFSGIAAADVNRWTYIGPDSADQAMLTIAVDPSSATTLYAGGYGAIVRTFDGGSIWSRTELVGIVSAIAIDPSSPSTVYAGVSEGVRKTNDAGMTWIAINSGLSRFGSVQQVTALAIDPSSPATLYAGTFLNGVFKSQNGGASWTEMNSGFPREGVFNQMPRIDALVVDPLTPSTLYAGSFRGVFKSTNGGSNWMAMTEGMRVFSEPLGVSSLVIDPLTPSTLYAGTSTLGVYKSTNGAESWRELPRPPSIPDFYAFPVRALAIHPLSPRTVYLAMLPNGPIDFGVLRTTDGGETWTPWNEGLPALAEISALAIDGTGTHLSAGSLHGIFAITIQEGRPAIQVPRHPPGTRIVAPRN